MENGLFRKKSMERISSPEALHDYMRVTSPRLWMILATVVVLLGGFIVYASTATMENVKQIKVQLTQYDSSDLDNEDPGTADSTFISAILPMAEMDVIKTGMKLRLGKEEGRVSWISMSEEDNMITVIFEMDHKYIPWDNGEYDAELVLESTTPISFLWN